MNTAIAPLEFLQPPQIPELLRFPVSPLQRERLNRALDEVSLKFVIASRTARAPVMDFGCGEGIATQAALARGAHVCAVDEDEVSIERLLARVPSQQHRRLRARAGNLLATDFKSVPFDAIHVARVLQEFDGGSIERVLKKFYRWLYPNGRLFLSALTPLGDYWAAFEEEYLRRCAQGVRWPGYLEDGSAFTGQLMDARPIHLLDENTLRRELTTAGFEIDEMRCLPLPWDDTQICCAVIARCNA
jgi:SAM-dependent methyltransferase